MNNSWSLSDVAECVKKVVDGVRCAVCDKAEGSRVRYSCGHTACDECLPLGEGCVLCLTPPSTSAVGVVDEPSSQRARSACNLLNIFQDTFNVKVYRSQREAEQLKTEKDLFPQCIQAPLKYFNKRKSLISQSFKENISSSLYPGEITSKSNLFKMNKSKNYVSQWLNNTENQPRKALADLQANYQNNKNENVSLNTNIKSSKQHIKKRNEDLVNKKRKRHSNSSYSLLDTSVRPVLKLNQTKTKSTLVNLNTKSSKERVIDESGIVLDDETILIEDSEGEVIDKDAQALLAVQLADMEQSSITDSSERDDCLPPVSDSGVHLEIKHSQNVPFIKKGPLCGHSTNFKSNDTIEIKEGNISLTIESEQYVTTISISNQSDVQQTNSSIHVQTDISDIPIPNSKVAIENRSKYSGSSVPDNKPKEQHQTKFVETLENASNIDEKRLRETGSMERLLQSPNIFDVNDELLQKKKCVIIDDSDGSTSSECSILCVRAEVHRTCEPHDYDILGELNTTELLCRPRKRRRGATPDSNNSSDKENCDPNKNKKCKNLKKGKLRKKM